MATGLLSCARPRWTGATFTAALAVSLSFGAGAVAAATPKAGRYTGTTSESTPVTLKVVVTKTKKIVHTTISGFSTSIGYNGKCGPGGGPGFEVTASSIKVNANGSFAGSLRFKGQVPGVAPDKGTVTGRIKGTTITGNIVDTTTARPGACNGYTETFKATMA